MDLDIKASFIDRWGRYFPGRELPIARFYSDALKNAEFPDAPMPNRQGLTCIFGQLAPVRRGKAHAYNENNLGCRGSKDLLGLCPPGLTSLQSILWCMSNGIPFRPFTDTKPLTAREFIVCKRTSRFADETRGAVLPEDGNREGRTVRWFIPTDDSNRKKGEER